YSPELVQDLHEFVNLIPSTVIDEIAAEHLLVDSGFRKAVTFMDSSAFKQLVERAEQLPEVVEVINFLHLNDTSIRVSAHVDNRLRRQLVLEGDAVKEFSYFVSNGLSEKSLEEGMVVVFLPESQNTIELPASLGSFVSFLDEVLTHLPRDRFVELIKEKCKTGKVFPPFYRAVRSADFKQLIEKTMKSQNVINILKTLASHEIDANGLKSLAFKIISWGPEV
ncbi:hypothetical protein KR093_007201, partial [Drosophila rubida]